MDAPLRLPHHTSEHQISGPQCSVIWGGYFPIFRHGDLFWQKCLLFKHACTHSQIIDPVRNIFRAHHGSINKYKESPPTPFPARFHKGKTNWNAVSVACTLLVLRKAMGAGKSHRWTKGRWGQQPKCYSDNISEPIQNICFPNGTQRCGQSFMSLETTLIPRP